MKSYLGLQTLLVGACLISGCSASGPIYQDAAPPKAGLALVYIYREDSSALSGRDATFLFNGTKVASLSNNGYTSIYVPIGHYHVKQRWPLDMIALGSLDQELGVKDGDTAYVQFGTGGNILVVRWQLSTQVPADVARREIAQCHHQEPLVAELSASGN